MATKMLIETRELGITSIYFKTHKLALYLQIYLQLLRKKKVPVTSCSLAFQGVDYLMAKNFLPVLH